MIGKIIGNYQITSELVRGGLGVVYRGQHLHLPREVLVKSILLSAFSTSAQIHLKARFRREAFIQSQLDHPNIVRVYEFFMAEDNYYLVMEYVQGVSLSDLLAQQGAPTPAQAVYLLKQALAALDYAHNFSYVDESDINHTGIIHRNIQPANLLLDNRGRLKITDFGIAKVLGEQSVTGFTQPGIHRGTTEYMSPEQIRGGEIDRRSDLYSLGVTFYEMLTCRLPFERSSTGSDYDVRKGHIEIEPPSILEQRPDLAPSLVALVMRALRKHPADRYQSAADFLDALRAYEQQQAADGTFRITNNKHPQQPLIVAADPDQEIICSAPPSQAIIENDTTIALEATNHVPAAATTQVISLAQSLIPLAAKGESELQMFSSLQQVSPKGRLTLIAAGLAMILVSAGAGAFLFSQQKDSDTEADLASMTESIPQTLNDTSPPEQKNPGRAKSSSGSNQASGEVNAIRNARLFEKQEKYEDAIKVYEEYIVRNPNAADTGSIESRLSQLKMLQSSLITADAALIAGKYKIAVQQYGAALRIKPDSQRAKDGFSFALAKIPDLPPRPAAIRRRPRIPNPIANPEIQAPSAEAAQVGVEPPSVNRPRPARGSRKNLKPAPNPVDQTPAPKPPDGEPKP